jgi:hypothetical protein
MKDGQRLPDRVRARRLGGFGLLGRLVDQVPVDPDLHRGLWRHGGGRRIPSAAPTFPATEPPGLGDRLIKQGEFNRLSLWPAGRFQETHKCAKSSSFWQFWWWADWGRLPTPRRSSPPIPVSRPSSSPAGRSWKRPWPWGHPARPGDLGQEQDLGHRSPVV